MIILDNDWSIEADADNWILIKGNRKRYYPTLKTLCNGWTDLKLREGVAMAKIDLAKIVALTDAEGAVKAQLEAVFKDAVGNINKEKVAPVKQEAEVLV